MARLQSPCCDPGTTALQGLHQRKRPVLLPLFCVPGSVSSVALSLCPQRRRSEGTDSHSALVIHTHKLSCETEKADNYNAVNYLRSQLPNLHFRELEKEEQTKLEQQKEGIDINKDKCLNRNKAKGE